MAMRLYLDEDIDPLLAGVLRERGVDCVSTYEAGNQGRSDADQLDFAARHNRAILTFNVRDFVLLAKDYADTGRHHGGIIVSDHLPFRELLRRVLTLLFKHADQDLTDQLLWLQDYKEPRLTKD